MDICEAFPDDNIIHPAWPQKWNQICEKCIAMKAGLV